MARIHIELPYLTIYWDEELSCVWMEWKRFVKGKDFRYGLDAGLSLLKDQRAGRWLADLRHLSVLDKEDKDWSVQDWFPRAIRAGLEQMAVVSPQAVIPRMSVDDVMKSADLSAVEVEYFSGIAQARAWLQAGQHAGNDPENHQERA